jgi:asparagine synthase (glutamine-hydrolysing)
MCGIVGYWSRKRPADARLAAQMAARIQHRGPDSSGVWVDAQKELALGHRRLSIIDLSPAGHQPMVSSCGRYVISYNGEIYNHAELRRDLERERGGFEWRGHSDTETLVAAIAHWGLAAALERANGMFALALWDQKDRTLQLARDRLGEKPLYYGRVGGTFFFASELSALGPHPDWNPQIDPDALALYFRLNCVPAPYSIYRGVHKLEPGRFVTVDQGGQRISAPTPYWDALDAARRGAEAPLHESEVVDSLDAALRQAVASRMEADVPLGAFLSGGIDSSTVVALMQAQSSRPVKTFTIGFNETQFDEAPYAREVAAHLGVDHTELYVSPADALNVIPELPSIWNEPFSDPSQIPTLLVSRLARTRVTVALSGDGGDELFYGYGRYATALRLRKTFGHIPRAVRPALGALLASPLVTLAREHNFPAPRLDLTPLTRQLLKARNDPEFYAGLRAHWLDAENVLSDEADRGRTAASGAVDAPDFADLRDLMMFMDMTGYLPDDILTKLDRASMSVGLEARAPLLDHRLVELAWRIPTSIKARDGVAKWPLRQVLNRYVPPRLFDRPKKGFGVPVGEWLKGPLREWAEDLLDERHLREDGLLNVKAVRSRWRDHVTGARPWPEHLWDVLVFLCWRRAGAEAAAGGLPDGAAGMAPSLVAT